MKTHQHSICELSPITKKSVEDVHLCLGIPMSTAIDMHLKQIMLTGEIPFRVSLPQAPEVSNVDYMTTVEDYYKIA